jgi:hypothetical protein
VPAGTKFARWLQYIYFLRVSLLLWLFLPLFCLLDLAGVSAALSRGIVTLDSGWQVFYATFFIVAMNMTVLVTARNTVRNGRNRFRSTPPDKLYQALTDSDPKIMWLVLFIVHLFSFVVIGYLEWTAVREGEQLYLLSLALGFAVALPFWYLVSLFYFWTYRPFQTPAGQTTKIETAALIFPRYKWLFGDVSDAVPPARLVYCVDRVTSIVLSQVGIAGYAASTDGPLWELHFLSGVSLAGIFLTYLFLYPLTAPVPRSTSAVSWQIAICCVLTAVFVYLIGNATDETTRPEERSRWAIPVKRVFLALAIGFALLFIGVLLFDHRTHSVRLALAFPTLGSILVLANFALWFFSGAAFFLDRFRVPVLTAVLALIFLPKVFAPTLGGALISSGHPILAEVFDSDHYFSVKPAPASLKLDNILTPGAAMTARAPDPSQPYIIVTASGGGIQAAEWTAQVLANLEKAFADDQHLRSLATPYTFHDHLLLASGVSGGSVGLMPFLLEYTAYQSDPKQHKPAAIFPNTSQLYDRITRPPGCSSLEAVGWGLTYHDLYRLITPVRITLALDDDTAPDRSRALASAFNRNLHDEHCKTDPRLFPKLASSPIRDGEGFTLYDAALQLAHGKIPAFTFNTTAAETGSRFLLSDYRLNPLPCGTDFTPAESFLQVYAAKQADCGTPSYELLRSADLPLATAARLSATFPIVSSGTRIPPAYSAHGYHFLDGGYFDNDGTSSAVEFLKSALDDPGQKLKQHKILLIEIRDDDGAVVTTDMDNISSQNGHVNNTHTLLAPPWTPISQLTGIAQGLWNAGHVSISRRNRRDLCILETAYQPGGLDIHHVVFTIPAGKDHLSPLSWNLTTSQLGSIIETANAPITTAKIQGAIQWVTDELTHPPGQEACQVF